MILRSLSIASVACCLMFSGCGGGDGGKISITGIVMCDGKPLPGASIAFIGNGGGAYGTGITNDAGEFVVRAVAGKNKVAVSKANTEKVVPTDPNADQSMPTEAEVAIMTKNAPKPLVAEKFADPERSGIVIDVVKGMTDIDINVTSK